MTDKPEFADMPDLTEREARLGLVTILEFDPNPSGKSGWWQMVTIERSGLRHYLTQPAPATPAFAKRIAKREGIRFVVVKL